MLLVLLLCPVDSGGREHTSGLYYSKINCIKTFSPCAVLIWLLLRVLAVIESRKCFVISTRD